MSATHNFLCMHLRSCWAHAATSAVEAAVAIEYSNSVPTVFSVQAVTSCTNSALSSSFSSGGCNCGLSTEAIAMMTLAMLPEVGGWVGGGVSAEWTRMYVSCARCPVYVFKLVLS